jgi:hypothetical protein
LTGFSIVPLSSYISFIILIYFSIYYKERRWKKRKEQLVPLCSSLDKGRELIDDGSFFHLLFLFYFQQFLFLPQYTPQPSNPIPPSLTPVTLMFYPFLPFSSSSTAFSPSVISRKEREGGRPVGEGVAMVAFAEMMKRVWREKESVGRAERWKKLVTEMLPRRNRFHRADSQ